MFSSAAPSLLATRQFLATSGPLTMVMWLAAVGPIRETNICRVFFKPEVVAYTEIRYFVHLVGVA